MSNKNYDLIIIILHGQSIEPGSILAILYTGKESRKVNFPGKVHFFTQAITTYFCATVRNIQNSSYFFRRNIHFYKGT